MSNWDGPAWASFLSVNVEISDLFWLIFKKHWYFIKTNAMISRFMLAVLRGYIIKLHNNDKYQSVKRNIGIIS